MRSDLSESIRPSTRSAHRSQLFKAGLERRHQGVDLRFGHRRGERARTRADDSAIFVRFDPQTGFQAAKRCGYSRYHLGSNETAAAAYCVRFRNEQPSISDSPSQVP
jgi:hypothetical protein